MDRLCNLIKAGDYISARTLLLPMDDISQPNSDGQTVMGILQYNIGISTMKHMIEAYKTYDTLQYISPNDIIKSYELLFELVVYCIKEKQVDGHEIDDWVIGMINETIDTAFDVIRYEKGDAYLNMLGGELEITDGMEIDDLIDRAMSIITIEASSTNTNTKCSPCGCSIC